jgi:DNA-directed RNA polymerase specialized sigma24 family protein
VLESVPAVENGKSPIAPDARVASSVRGGGVVACGSNHVLALKDAEWEEVLERLTLYADNCLVRLTWRGLKRAKGGAVPGGIEAADLAQAAIVDVIEGARRYDRAAQPDFFRFLQDVVDSKVNHLATSAENRKSRRPADSLDDDAPVLDRVDRAPPPEDQVADDEALARLRGEARDAVAKDPLARQIFECLDASVTKPGEIATLLGISVEEIYNAQKRLARLVGNTSSGRKARSGR